MNWENLKLGDIIEIKKGKYITKKESQEGPYPVILGGQEPAYYIDTFNHTGKAIVVSRSGASAGYVSFWNEPIYVTDGFLIEPQCRVDVDFLYYLMKFHQPELQRKQGGSAIPHVNPRILNAIEIKLPPEPIQKRIVDTLSSFDEFIKDNNKRIAILEQMAENLYKEWFVRFRFPGYENAKFVDGLPKGWEYVKLGEYANISTGKCNREDAEEDGIYPLFDRSQEIKRSSTWLKDCEAIIVPGEGTSFIPRYYKGKFNLHQRCYCVEPKIDNIGQFIFQTLMLNRIYFLYVATGATVPSLRQNNFTNMKILMPDISLVRKFEEIVSTQLQKINLLKESNENLIKQRDLLLPRLMSGKLEV